MMTAISDDLFTREVTDDPYTYFGRLREEDPVHWNELYELWVVTRHDDLVWLTRHHELFSSEVLKRDPRPPYPQVNASDLELYEYVRDFSSDQFIQHDRPEHLEMRKVIHGYFTPRSMEAWRPMVQSAITDLLDAAEAKGRMEVMAGFATPLPVLVNCSLLLLAGHETTINLLCNGTLAFLRHPGQWALFKQDPARWAKRATE